MTTTDDAGFNGQPYLLFGVEGVPYSKVVVPATEEWIVEGVRLAKFLADCYGETFYPPFTDQIAARDRGEPERIPVGEEFAESAPPPPRPPQGQRPPAQGAPKSPRDGQPQSGEACDQCGASPVWWVPGFTNKKTGKDVSPRIICTNCKDGQYDHLVRWVPTAAAGVR